MKRSTTELIESLVADGAAVRVLRSPFRRAAGWLLFAALLVACVALAHGARPDLASKLHDPGFVTSVGAAVATGVLAALAAFVASVPGRSMRWLWLPVPALLVWISAIGYGCLTNWVAIGPDGVSLGETARCFATLVLVGVPLGLALIVMLRHVATLAPLPAALAGALAVSAMTAAALSVFHPLDATVMILAWHFGLTVILLAGGARFARRLFEWAAPPASVPGGDA
ncbi:NrsF family protein [Burkholderia ubonensis]|uniref:DUF1109 domain-containing protein n=1 Tax=Burkholderia ubonensis subsp. mesacidophila TaxID=265293 RepID=A0A2A4FN19_9BURK|nr:DUF1109 domain-containing protein [Burkholderia ubonensis]PCE34457.1 hypothetical protein BZL54_00290 [Burkholderia ubonensis subsp. mesacidophila]